MRSAQDCQSTPWATFDFQAAYDELNPTDDDYRFYVDLAASLGATRAVDLGCGTGTLARSLASRGLEVVGVDPDPDMLRVAGSKDRNAWVDWRLGYSDVLEPELGDFAVMSGHVAQVFTDDEAWIAALSDLHEALVEGGTLAFESRNPSARKWKGWTRELTLRTVDTPDGGVEFWHETAAVSLPVVSYHTLTRNVRTGESTTECDTLAFRDEEALRASVERVGFQIADVFGDWDRTPPMADSPELIMIARKR
ncbi:MAG: class I SAM-dependent methyltransferase [Nocardioidaceae bacterium]